MDKERSVKTDGGYSEEEMDSAMDKTNNLNQVKAVNIFDSKKIKDSHKK
jgi:hypothetical protein